MRPMIHVQPAAELRRPFAVWATAQRPKIRTVSTSAFAVPAGLFAGMPEELLIGALIDGHGYVSPVEDATLGRPAPGAPDPGGEADIAPADTAALVPAAPSAAVGAVMTAAAVVAAAAEPLPPGDDQRPPTQAEEAPEIPEGVFPCPHCDKELTTARGRDMHARKVHGMGVEE